MLHRRVRLSPLLVVAAAGLLAVSGCRGAEPMEEPPATVQAHFEAAAQGSAEVAGTYRFARLDTKAAPAAAAFIGGCRVYVTDGTMDLVADGRYRLALDTRRVCSGQSEERQVVKEGLYAAVGHRILFGDRMLLTREPGAPEVTTGPEDIVAALFPDGRFAANGSLRITRLSATVADLRTYFFYREEGTGAAPQAAAPTTADE